MQIQKTAEMMYRLQTILTSIELLFEGKWWIPFLTKIGVIEFHGLVMQAHNELVSIRGCSDRWGQPIAWDYKPFYSKEKNHRMFEDPMHGCYECQRAQRLRPTLKNILLKKFKIGKYKNAVLLAVD